MGATTSKPMRRLRKDLRRMVEPRFELPRELYTRRLLDEEEYDKLLRKCEHSGVFAGCDYLLKVVARKSRDKNDHFLTSLKVSEQSHVLSFVRVRGGK